MNDLIEKIEKSASWSNPTTISTKYGLKLLREAQPTKEISKLWNENKETLKKLGISWSKDEYGLWKVCWWSELPAKNNNSNLTCDKNDALEKFIEKLKNKNLSPFPYQIEGARFLLSVENGLLADEMGLGKTIQALLAIGTILEEAVTSIKIVLIAPATLRLNWQAEIQKWISNKITTTIINNKEFSINENTHQILIFSYEYAVKYEEFLKSQTWDILILDEAHKCKSQQAERTKVILGRNNKDFGIPAKKKWFLTGTPILNRPVELFPMMKHLYKEINFEFFTFAKRYCNAHQTRFGWDFSGASNIDELSNLLKNVMLRRKKSDVLTQLPDKIRQLIYLSSQGIPEIAEEFKFFNNLSDEDKLKFLHGGVTVGEIAKIREKIGLKKCDLLEEVLEEILEENEKIVIFAHHHSVIDRLAEIFHDKKIEYTVVDGRTSMEKRQKAIDNFQNKNTRVFIGSIRACGEGITLTSANKVIFVELDWVPAILQQAEDRLHRISQKNTVFAYYLVFQDSLDAKFMKALINKEEISLKIFQ